MAMYRNLGSIRCEYGASRSFGACAAASQLRTSHPRIWDSGDMHRAARASLHGADEAVLAAAEMPKGCAFCVADTGTVDTPGG